MTLLSAGAAQTSAGSAAEQMLQIQQLAASASVTTEENDGLVHGVAIMWRSSMSLSRVLEDW